MPGLMDLAAGRASPDQFLQQLLGGAAAGAAAPKPPTPTPLITQYRPQTAQQAMPDPGLDLGLLADLVQRQRMQRQGGGGLRYISGGGGGYGGGSGSGFDPGVVGRDLTVDIGGGIYLHRDIANQGRAMLDAARAQGINLTGSGWRSIEATRRLQYKRALGIPVARPGRSMHERGAAIDFSNLSSAGFRWLQQNAGKYGFRNLPSERWHWSTTGR